MRKRRSLLLCLSVVRPIAGVCEDWCVEPCTMLNGDVTVECRDCTSANSQCYEGAEGWGTWKERSEAHKQGVAISPDGGQVAEPEDPDAPIERTDNSVVYAATYYEICNRKRDAEGRIKGEAAHIVDFEEPLPLPQESPRHCKVHSCVLVDGDEPCAEGRAECLAPRGHLQKIGDQVAPGSLQPVAEYDVSTGALNASSFWTDVLSKYRPHVMRGGAASATDLSSWTNEALLKVCKLENGAPWRVLVEKQNRITQNDRHPLMPGDWDFCKFLTEYQKPEYDNMLYLVTGIADKGLRLPSLIGLPSVLACDDLYHALHDARLWMSRGNTTSSLHFDTHDNLLMQIDGEKEVRARSVHTRGVRKLCPWCPSLSCLRLV